MELGDLKIAKLSPNVSPPPKSLAVVLEAAAKKVVVSRKSGKKEVEGE